MKSYQLIWKHQRNVSWMQRIVLIVLLWNLGMLDQRNVSWTDSLLISSLELGDALETNKKSSADLVTIQRRFDSITVMR